MIHGEKPCPIQSPSALLRGLLRSSRSSHFLKLQSYTCDTDLQVCLCWSFQIRLPEEGEGDRAFSYSPPFPDPPRTWIPGNAQIYGYRFPMKEWHAVQHPACFSLCDKYGSLAPAAFNLANRWEHLANRRKAAGIKRTVISSGRGTNSPHKTTMLCPNTQERGWSLFLVLHPHRLPPTALGISGSQSRAWGKVGVLACRSALESSRLTKKKKER